MSNIPKFGQKSNESAKSFGSRPANNNYGNKPKFTGGARKPEAQSEQEDPVTHYVRHRPEEGADWVTVGYLRAGMKEGSFKLSIPENLPKGKYYIFPKEARENN